MKIKHYEDLDLQELDVMREIGSIGTSHAATALSKLLTKETRITIPTVNILGYEEAVERIGTAEDIVAAALVKMEGDIEGLMLFLFDLELANTILGRLLGKTWIVFWKWMKWRSRHWLRSGILSSVPTSTLFRS